MNAALLPWTMLIFHKIHYHFSFTPHFVATNLIGIDDIIIGTASTYGFSLANPDMVNCQRSV